MLQRCFKVSLIGLVCSMDVSNTKFVSEFLTERNDPGTVELFRGGKKVSTSLYFGISASF